MMVMMMMMMMIHAGAQIRRRTRTHTLCEPAKSKCMSTCHKNQQKISEEAPYTVIYRKNATAQNTDTHFARACAVQMHDHMSQETSEEPPCTEIYRKNATAQIGPRTQTHTLREPGQSKCISRFHKSHFSRKFTGKMTQTKWSSGRGRTLCASLRSRNACQDCTKATLYSNSQATGYQLRLQESKMGGAIWDFLEPLSWNIVYCTSS